MAGNVMQFFAQFLETTEHKLSLAFCEKDGDEMTIITTFYKGGEIIHQPFSVRGTIEDLAKQNGYWEKIERFSKELLPAFSNLDDLEKQVKEAEKALQERMKKAQKVPEVKKGRCAGAFDQEAVNDLLTKPMDDAYAKILAGTNLQTMLEVLPLIADIEDKKRFNKVSAELKKVTGAGAEDQGIMFDKPVEDKQLSMFA